MPVLTKAQIQQLIPHRDPFLWIDEIVDVAPDRIVAQKFVDPALDLFRGHYPGKPVLPGVIICEASMQAGAVLIAHQGDPLAPGKVPVAARMNNVKFKHMVVPGDTLRIEVELTDRLKDTYYMSAQVQSGGKTAATLEFTCMAVPG